jgi:hypothetical protein
MRDFATITRLVLIAAVLLTAPGQVRAEQETNLLLNGGAEEGQGGRPSIWRAAQNPAEGLRMWQDTEHARTGRACLAIANTHQYERPVSNNWAQDLQSIPKGKLIRLTANIKTRNSENVNVCFQCWSAHEDKLLAFGSTPMLRGTNDWIALHSEEVLVPPETAAIIVRAALTGTGEAFFDDLDLSIVSTPMTTPADASLDAEVNGRIVRRLPITQDAMIISYIADSRFGTWDYTAVANNKSGVRMLLSFESPSAEEIAQPGLEFFLALFARKTTYSPPTGHVEVHEILNEWDERYCSWQEQPSFAPEPATRVEMLPSSNSWRIIDLTALIRQQARSGRRNFGVVLKFDEEDRSAEPKQTWSGYQFVSREGMPPRRPVLLVVDPTKPPDSRPAESRGSDSLEDDRPVRDSQRTRPAPASRPAAPPSVLRSE